MVSAVGGFADPDLGCAAVEADLLGQLVRIGPGDSSRGGPAFFGNMAQRVAQARDSVAHRAVVTGSRLMTYELSPIVGAVGGAGRWDESPSAHGWVMTWSSSALRLAVARHTTLSAPP